MTREEPTEEEEAARAQTVQAMRDIKELLAAREMGGVFIIVNKIGSTSGMLFPSWMGVELGVGNSLRFNFDWSTPEQTAKSNKALSVIFGLAEQASELARALQHIANTVQTQLDKDGLKLKNGG